MYYLTYIKGNILEIGLLTPLKKDNRKYYKQLIEDINKKYITNPKLKLLFDFKNATVTQQLLQILYPIMIEKPIDKIIFTNDDYKQSHIKHQCIVLLSNILTNNKNIRHLTICKYNGILNKKHTMKYLQESILKSSLLECDIPEKYSNDNIKTKILHNNYNIIKPFLKYYLINELQNIIVMYLYG